LMSKCLIILCLLSTSAIAARKDFGNGWIDEDSDCQNARTEILMQQGAAYHITENKCAISDGIWFLPYSATVETKASKIDIDHVVPLNYAWYNGAQSWTRSRRIQFANDPENLLVSSRMENRSKGDSPPEEWMPANTAYWCTYTAKWDNIIQKYSIPPSPSTEEFLKIVRESCKRYEKAQILVDNPT